MNETAANASDLEGNSPEVIQSMITTLQIKLDKSYNLSQIKLNRSHNSIIVKIDLNSDPGIRLVHELAKSLIMISSMIQKLKTNNEVINNPIYGNSQCKTIDKVS